MYCLFCTVHQIKVILCEEVQYKKELTPSDFALSVCLFGSGVLGPGQQGASSPMVFNTDLGNAKNAQPVDLRQRPDSHADKSSQVYEHGPRPLSGLESNFKNFEINPKINGQPMQEARTGLL